MAKYELGAIYKINGRNGELYYVRLLTNECYGVFSSLEGELNEETFAILCILSFQDWLSIDGKWRNPNVAEERINVPSNPRNYWRYRMHLTLEQLMKAKTLNDKISELIKYTGRDPNK